MQRARTYVSLGVLALAVAFQLGARTAAGQAGVSATGFAVTPSTLYTTGVDASARSATIWSSARLNGLPKSVRKEGFGEKRDQKRDRATSEPGKVGAPRLNRTSNLLIKSPPQVPTQQHSADLTDRKTEPGDGGELP